VVHNARIDLFISAIALVYLAALAFGLRALLHRSIGPGLRWARRVVLSLAALGAGCFAYAWRIEPYWLEVTRTRVATAKLSRAVRVVQLSDELETFSWMRLVASAPCRGSVATVNPARVHDHAPGRSCGPTRRTSPSAAPDSKT
jgi:hypothetical protein